jgi:hypothetical protein
VFTHKTSITRRARARLAIDIVIEAFRRFPRAVILASTRAPLYFFSVVFASCVINENICSFYVSAVSAASAFTVKSAAIHYKIAELFWRNCLAIKTSLRVR